MFCYITWHYSSRIVVELLYGIEVNNRVYIPDQFLLTVLWTSVTGVRHHIHFFEWRTKKGLICAWLQQSKFTWIMQLFLDSSKQKVKCDSCAVLFCRYLMQHHTASDWSASYCIHYCCYFYYCHFCLISPFFHKLLQVQPGPKIYKQKSETGHNTGLMSSLSPNQQHQNNEGLHSLQLIPWKSFPTSVQYPSSRYTTS